MVHVRFEGRSFDLPSGDRRIHAALSDREILDRVADRLEVPRHRVAGHVVDRVPGGGLIVRP